MEPGKAGVGERADAPAEIQPAASARGRCGLARAGAVMGQTVTEKIAQAHLAEGPKRPLRAGDFVSLRPRRLMTHDNTSAVLQKFQAMGATRLFDPGQLVFPLDHDIQNQSEENQAKYRKIEAFAREHGVDFYPAGTGI